MAAFFPITQMIDRRKIGFRVLSDQDANIDTTTGVRHLSGDRRAVIGAGP
jgi:hypothetical protein